MESTCADCPCGLAFTQQQRGSCRCGHPVDRHPRFCVAEGCPGIAVKLYRCNEHVGVVFFPAPQEAPKHRSGALDRAVAARVPDAQPPLPERPDREASHLVVDNAGLILQQP